MTNKSYLLDTNVFVQAHRNYYGLDLCPGFWDVLRHFQHQGRLQSLDRVRDEIREGDALADWIAEAPDGFFVDTATPDVAAKYAELMAWANAADFTAAAKAEFAGVADGWLVAYAAVHDLVIVTHESLEPDRKSRVKIPNACQQFRVEWANTFWMLRELEVKFNWTVPS
jgi:hypothetical protein